MTIIYSNAKAIDVDRGITISSSASPARLEDDSKWGSYLDHQNQFDFFFEYASFSNLTKNNEKKERSIYRKYFVFRNNTFLSFIASELLKNKINDGSNSLLDIFRKNPEFDQFSDWNGFLLHRNADFRDFIFKKVDEGKLEKYVNLFEVIIKDIKDGLYTISLLGKKDASFLYKFSMIEMENQISAVKLREEYVKECISFGLDVRA